MSNNSTSSAPLLRNGETVSFCHDLTGNAYGTVYGSFVNANGSRTYEVLVTSAAQTDSVGTLVRVTLSMMN